jgi:hypothetical protein
MSRRPKISKSTAIGCVAASLWVVLAAGLFQLFRPFDWESGTVRALLLLALALLAFGPLLIAHRLQFEISPPTWFQRLTVVLISLLALEHFRFTFLSIRDHRRMEIGEIHFHALRLLNRGINPYGRTTVLDPIVYEGTIGFDFVQACTTLRPEEAEKRLKRFWDSLEPADMEPLIPTMKSGPECAEARRWVSMSGLKYGPVMLLSYYPLVLLFGRPGIYLTHLGLALLLAMLLIRRQRWRHPGSLLLGLVPLAIVLGPWHLRFLTLRHSDCDLIPTVLAIAGLLLLERGHPRAAGALIGLSVGAKLFPGLLYLPLLLGAPKKSWFWAFVVIALAFVPFVAWDATGFLNNIFVFNLIRSGDSTAWANVLSPEARGLLIASYLTGLLLLIWRAHQGGWPKLHRLGYLVLAHVGLFLTAKLFHNNYLIWLLPLYGLWLSDALALFDRSRLRPGLKSVRST